MELKLRHKAIEYYLSQRAGLAKNPRLGVNRLAVTSGLSPAPDMSPRRND